jgi:hypothetical protein
MNMVEGVGQQQPQDTARQRVQGAPAEPQLPAGKALRSVQALPLPLISQPEGPRPVLDEQAMHRLVAQTRTETFGTGVIVNTIA